MPKGEPKAKPKALAETKSPTNLSKSLFPKSSLAKSGSITVSKGKANEVKGALINARASPNGVFETKISPNSDTKVHTKEMFIVIRIPRRS